MRCAYAAASAYRDILCAGRQGDVLFFDRKAASENPWTRSLDLRSSDEPALYIEDEAAEARGFGRFLGLLPSGEPAPRKGDRAFKGSLMRVEEERQSQPGYFFWLKDDSLEDSSSLPDPDVLAAEIVDDLQSGPR